MTGESYINMLAYFPHGRVFNINFQITQMIGHSYTEKFTGVVSLTQNLLSLFIMFMQTSREVTVQCSKDSRCS